PLSGNQDVVEPLPEKPLTGNPVPENQDAYKELNKQNTPLPPKGGFDPDFEILWNEWPSEHRPEHKGKALRIFGSLTDQGRSDAVAGAALYCRTMAARGKPRRMISYLSDRLFLDFIDPPKIDKDGRFVIDSKRPEWSAWLGEVRRLHGDQGVASVVRL